MNPYKHLRLLLLPVLVFVGYAAGGNWNFITPLVLFVFLPLLQFAQLKQWNGYEHLKKLPLNNASKIIPYLFIPVLVALVVVTTILSDSNTLRENEFFGLALSVGIVNGTVGFILAHEFIHKHSFRESWPGYVLLALVNYYHYSIEHIYGHHVYVCTTKDPNTAQKGESFYQFLPRAVCGTFLNAIEIEKRRLQKKNHRFWSVHNRVLVFLFLQLATWLSIYKLLSIEALLFFLIQSFVAITLLYIINYMQHYGLVRQENAAGRFEKIAAHHAWRPAGPAHAFSIFQVENHADHHLHPTHTYETLVNHEESPQLPAPYASMVLIVLLPPLWFNLIHKRIPAHL